MSQRWSVTAIKVADGQDAASVIERLADAWDIERERVAHLIVRLPTVVKTLDDHEEALRYQHRLEELGLVAAIDETDAKPIPAPPAPSPPTPPIPTGVNAGSNTTNGMILVALILAAIVTGWYVIKGLLERTDLPEMNVSLPDVKEMVTGQLDRLAPQESRPVDNKPKAPRQIGSDPTPLVGSIRDLTRPAWWDGVDAPTFTTVDELLDYWRDKERTKLQFAKAAFALMRSSPENDHVVMTVANLYPHVDPDYPQLESMLTTALARFPDHRLIEYGRPADTVAGVTRDLASLLIKRGRPEEAVEVIETFLEARESETNDHLLELMALQRAKGLIRSGRKNDAILVLGIAIEKYHGDWEKRLIEQKKKYEGR